MASPQVRFTRRSDRFRAYDVWLPLGENSESDGWWVRVGLMTPWFVAATDHTGTNPYKLLPPHSCSAGVVRPCWEATFGNGRLTESAAWGSIAEGSSGGTSGSIAKYTSTQNRYVSCKCPAGANKVVVRHNPRSDQAGRTCTVSIEGGDTLGTFTPIKASASNCISDAVFDVTPSDSDRVLRVTITAASGWSVFLIAVLCFDTDGIGDPGELDATDGLLRGNQLYETYYDAVGGAPLPSYAGTGANNHAHIPIRAGYGAYRILSPNVVHMTIYQDNAAAAHTQKWTADNSPHWNSATTDLPLVPDDAVPTVFADGVTAGDITNVAVMPYGSKIECDVLTIRQSGACHTTDSPTLARYQYSYSADGIGLNGLLTFTNNGTTLTQMYLPSWNIGNADPTGDRREALSGYALVPNDSTKYPSLVDATVQAQKCDIYIDDTPIVVELSSSGPDAYLLTNSTSNKFYIAHGACPSQPAIAANMDWQFGGNIRFKRRPFNYWGGSKG